MNEPDVDRHASLEPNGAQSTTAPPRKWWQWFLVYPAIGVAFIGAIPSVMELINSQRLGVPFGRSVDAREQNQLWENNFACVQSAMFTTITNEYNVQMGSVVCPSGDVLLRCKRPEWRAPHLRWVAWGDVANAIGSDKGESKFSWVNGLVPPAEAEDSPSLIPTQVSVLCQRWVGNGLLLQRIGSPYGCYDQIINTYAGVVVSSRPAPCTPRC